MIDQTMKGGFRFRNINEEETVKIAAISAGAIQPEMLAVMGESAYDTVLQKRERQEERDSGSIKKEDGETVMIERAV